VKILITAPLCPAEESGSRTASATKTREVEAVWQPWAPRSMRDKGTYSVDFLDQEWVSLPGVVHLPKVQGSATSIVIASVSGIHTLSYELQLDIEPRASSSSLLEEACATSAEAILSEAMGRRYQARWVNRSLLLFDSREMPNGWLGETTVELRLDSTRFPRDTRMSRLGWGNNLLVGYELLATEEKDEVRRGLIDDQTLWVGIDDIAFRSSTVASRQSSMSQYSRRDVTESAREIETLLLEASSHSLLFDEVMMNLQGFRREVVLAQLEAWRYPEFYERIERRLDRLERISTKQRHRIDQSYQDVVEKVLTVLGVLAGAQLILSVVELAFQGGVDTTPGGSALGLMYALRVVNTDLWVVISLLIVAAILIRLNRARSRSVIK